MRGRELLDDYDFYRFHTTRAAEMRDRGVPVKCLSATKDRLRALEEMASWCEENGLDSGLWLYSLFRRSWMRFAPRFDQLIPSKRSMKKQLKRYHELGDVPLYRDRCRMRNQARVTAAGENYDPNRDLSSTTEAIKRLYLRDGDLDGCMQDERTLGYHPRSNVCAGCSGAQACAAKLLSTVSFDILALRRGEITSTQAQGVVACRG